MSERHAQQVKDWNGQSGESWVIHQAWLDQMLDPFGDAAIKAAAPAPGEAVMDIGCGAGATSFALADHVEATGSVLGVDISRQLIGRADELAAGRANCRFLLADAGQADLPLAQFDLLFSRFGVMFFDDPAAAFARLKATLKPSGRLTFVCWRKAEENDWVRVPMGAVRGIVPASPPPPAGAPGPFSFGDKDHVTAILEQAGFRQITFTPYDQDITFGRGATQDTAIESALSMAFEVGPLSRALTGQPPEIRERASDAVRAAFARQATDDSVIINGAAWIVTARPD